MAASENIGNALDVAAELILACGARGQAESAGFQAGKETHVYSGREEGG